MSGPAQNIHNIYDPLWEHDACGIGAVVNLKGTLSHATVDSALKIVEKLEHRAGKDAAGETGDGVGLMIQVPHKLMVKAASAEGIALGGPRDYGVGMFFFPADALKRAQAQKMLEIIASSSVIILSLDTSTLPVSASTKSSHRYRPIRRSCMDSMTSLPSRMSKTSRPVAAPQSSSRMITSWETSTRRRVR